MSDWTFIDYLSWGIVIVGGLCSIGSVVVFRLEFGVWLPWKAK